MARWKFDSKSDAVANIMLGVPLGFGLLGLTCVDRRSHIRELALGLLLLPACAAFSATVEFAQLYCPSRTCAGSDVLMQTIGVVVGMSVWMVAGQRLTEQARLIWSGPAIGGSAGRWLVAYLVLLAFLQALPLDLTLSPADLYRKVRDGHAHFIPFGEFLGSKGPTWDRVRSLIEVAALYLPVGLLLGCLPGRFWRSLGNAGPIFGLAVLFAAGMEAIQMFVMSRTPSATDVLFGALTVLLAWWFAAHGSRRAPVGVAWVVWSGVLLIANWQPFNFVADKSHVEWLPFLPLEMRNPLYALEDLLTKLVLFAPLGVAAVCTWRDFKHQLWLAAALGAGVSSVCETGQVFLPSHTPSVTDVMLGGAGAWAGGFAASRVISKGKTDASC
jgi:VanZ family protein